MRVLLLLMLAAPLAQAEDQPPPSFHGTLKQLLPLIEKLGEVRVTLSPAVQDERIDLTLPEAAGPSDVVRAFDRTLEGRGMAFVAREGGRAAASFEVVRFVAEEQAPPAPRMEVGVAEGSVKLVGDKGSTAVSAGEESALDASGRPAQPTPIDGNRVGAWREAPLAATPAALARVPLPALRVRRVGRTAPDGLPIVEYSLPAVDAGDGVVAEVEPTKVVLAKDGAVVTVAVRVRLK